MKFTATEANDRHRITDCQDYYYINMYAIDLTVGQKACSISPRNVEEQGLTHQVMRTSPIRESATLAVKRKGLPISADASKCTGCLICELRCSLRFEKGFNPAKAAIVIRRQVQSANEYDISFTDRCDSCGICARYCSYGALTQENRRKEA